MKRFVSSCTRIIQFMFDIFNRFSNWNPKNKKLLKINYSQNWYYSAKMQFFIVCKQTKTMCADTLDFSLCLSLSLRRLVCKLYVYYGSAMYMWESVLLILTFSAKKILEESVKQRPEKKSFGIRAVEKGIELSQQIRWAQHMHKTPKRYTQYCTVDTEKWYGIYHITFGFLVLRQPLLKSHRVYVCAAKQNDNHMFL